MMEPNKIIKEEIKEVVKVHSGDDIAGLFSRSSSSDVEVKSKKYGTLKFNVRPMTNAIYAKMGDVIKSTGMDIANLHGIDGLKVFSDVYYPAIKVVFPYCCISPKVVDGTSTEKGALEIDNIPPEICIDLFSQIMRVSGISEEAEEIRKN